MPRNAYHLAQVNIGRLTAPLDSPILAGFVNNLDRINALAEESPGFVWRLVGEGNDATSLRPYDDDMIIVNMSVWESVEQLQAYVYKSDHTDIMRGRKQWFSKMDFYMCMWWVRVGHIPTVKEAKERLEHMEQHGESAHSFTFRNVFPPPDLEG
jgi:hypothetical protein